MVVFLFESFFSEFHNISLFFSVSKVIKPEKVIKRLASNVSMFFDK